MRTGVWQLVVRRPWIALVAALAIEAIALMVGRGDFVPSDPLWYADIAHRLATAPSDVFAAHDTHPFMMRIGLTGSLALLYRVFGVSTLVSNLPCTLAALGIMVVVYAAAPTPRAKLLGVVFCLACRPLARHAVTLNVDLPCAALMACSVLGLSRRDGRRGAWWLVSAAVAWIAAFLVKETAIWCGAVWAYAMVIDARSIGPREAARRFAPAIAVVVMLAVGYAVFCAEIWGSPWARFHGIEELTFDHSWTLHGKGAGAWLGRLTWQPAVLLATMFRAALVPVALAPWLVRGRERIWWFSTVAFAALYWLGSTSLSSYSPLPISQRMILPVLPGLLVLAAIATDRMIDQLRGRRWAIGVAVVLAIAVIVPGVHTLAALLVRGHPETDVFAALRNDSRDPARRVIAVCSEPRCVDISSFYFGFAPPKNFIAMFAADFAQAPCPDGAPGTTVRVLVNLPRSTDPQLDRTSAIEALDLPWLAGDHSVRLYDAGNGTRLWQVLRDSETPGTRAGRGARSR